ncbi:MAG: flagellar brake protein [Burkholderiales bacterium]|nr:flagellar brake protein [Burkholderiales bacterium]
MFQDTRPAEIDPAVTQWAEFRVTHPAERLRLLRELRDGSVPVSLNAPDGTAITVGLWSLDQAPERLNFSIESDVPQLEALVDADEAVAVAYLASVKLQFDLHGFVLVRGPRACALHCAMPAEIYRFQRRNSFRVRTASRHDPVARFRHPALPDITMTLRMLDLSIGGCALWLPSDLPPLQPGTRLGEVQVELDFETRFAAPATLQHVTSIGQSEHGARLGCEWQSLSGAAERVLQRWIDRSQQRRRRLSLE